MDGQTVETTTAQRWVVLTKGAGGLTTYKIFDSDIEAIGFLKRCSKEQEPVITGGVVLVD